MSKLHTDSRIVGGVDHNKFDQRSFDPSRDDIKTVCLFFSLGKLKIFEKEKGVVISHSNPFVWTKTNRGTFALKFYPSQNAQAVINEFAVNRYLTKHKFPTPFMLIGDQNKPFLKLNDHLVTCYPFINGSPVWPDLKKPGTIRKINSAVRTLKDLLSKAPGHSSFLKQPKFPLRIKELARISSENGAHDTKNLIERALKDTLRCYARHQPLFSCHYLHNNTNLNNFLFFNGTTYILDLSHVQKDYILSDLASMTISCFFFEIPPKTIRAIVDDYLIQHSIGAHYLPVLNTLIKIGLINEYLKNTSRRNALRSSAQNAKLYKEYLSQINKRKKLILSVLSKKTNNSAFIA